MKSAAILLCCLLALGKLEFIIQLRNHIYWKFFFKSLKIRLIHNQVILTVLIPSRHLDTKIGRASPMAFDIKYFAAICILVPGLNLIAMIGIFHGMVKGL
ncbi:hypothetical protein TKK_0017322 [Trichogramma kaykai]